MKRSKLDKFAADLLALQRSLGMSQRNLAEEFGFSKSAVNTWLTGRVFPQLVFVQRLVSRADGDLEMWTTRWKELSHDLASDEVREVVTSEVSPMRATLSLHVDSPDSLARMLSALPSGTVVECTLTVHIP